MEPDRSISTRVIEKIAERRGIDPIEMHPHLYDVIDPDGLDQFFSEVMSNDEKGTAQVKFTCEQYTVRVEDSGEITVTEQARGVGADEGAAASSGTN